MAIVEKSRKPVSLPFPSAERKPRFDSRFLRSYSAAILSPSLTSLGPSFSFLRRDRYPRLYYKYTCNSVRRRGSPAPLLLLLPPPPVGVETDAVHERSPHVREIPADATVCTALLFSARSRVLYMAGTISAFVPNLVPRNLPSYLLSLSLFLSPLRPFLVSSPPSSLLPVPWAERSGTHLLARIPTARGIKYNKDIQWELIGYLRIYRSLRAALLLRRGPRDGARAPPPLFSPSPRSFFSSLFPTPPSLPPSTSPLAALRISPFCRPSRRVEWRYSAVE